MKLIIHAPIIVLLLLHAHPVLADEPTTADEVLARYVAALGGHEQLAARQTLRITGTTSLPDDMQAKIVNEYRRPMMYRSQLTPAPDTGLPTVTYGYDGQVGWHIMPMFGSTEPQELPPDMVRIFAELADLDGPLVDAKAKGHRVELIGREQIDARPVYRLKLTLKGAGDGEFDDCYIDAETWLLVKTVGQRTVLGQVNQIERTYSDYHRVAGVMIPYTERTVTTPPKSVHVLQIENVETNVALPVEHFNFAAIKEAARQATEATDTTNAKSDTPTGTVRNDAHARQLYDEMIAAFRNPKTLSFDSTYELRLGTFPTTCTYQAWLKKPNQFRLEAHNPQGKTTGILIGDGLNLWIHWPNGRPYFYSPGTQENQLEYERTRNSSYMTKPAPLARHSIGHEVALLGSGILMNILDLSTFHGYTDSLQRLIDGVASAGTETINDEPCDVLDLSFMDGQRTWRLWVAQRDHLPRKLCETVRVAREIHAQETWSNIRINQPIPDELFAWKPPEGWQRWQMPDSEATLLKPGTTAPNFNLKLTDGKPVQLSDFRGKMVWLVFWRSG